ncbi:hypothetical protein AB6A40_008850 [Gnathostoma spinigerum]|uniref:Uncharacterized protein n=1 Tax=Gnathostoma spinigerum TaxID=75299 RepID=A0ABD6ES37_9BILA
MALLMTATKALFVHGTAVGVVGMEFMADTLVRTMAKIGCSPADLRNWCFLLDEHAYVVYSSNNNTRYDNLFTTNSPDRNHNILGQWFGEVNRITERTMSLLIKNNFYTETKYVDYQATCKHDHTRRMLIGSASRCVSSVVKMIVWMVVRLWRFLWNFSAFSTITSLLQPISAYTATFHGGEERFSCDMSATFYLANWGEEGWSGRRQPQSAALISSGLSERPCRHNSAKCAVKMYASWVRGTNLLLVVISQTNAITTGSCYDKTQCPLSAEFQHSFSEVYNASGKQIAINLELSDPLSENPEFDHRCRHIRSKHRKIPSKCIPSDYDESDLPCSNCFLSLKRQWLYSLFCFPVLYLYQHLIF